MTPTASPAPLPIPPPRLQACGRRLVFLANVDPVDSVRALHDLDPETTLAIVVRQAGPLLF
jgi:glucose-6-phosphate isomerase